MLNIEKTLFQFIWKYSKRDQFILLAVTTTLFPFLFLTLELPKRIINDAIGAQSTVVEFAGLTLSQVQFLAVLCGAFLLSVLVFGLLKMRINTMKGVLSERLLRRLRYGLIARMLRFPKPYFQRTSQGEIVAMVTGETEPMGGMMGDALTQPVLQAGQMLTILVFLFLQSFWFGLAAIALIPLQAWLIPRLQRQINLLNKARIKEIRQLAAEIGESAAGAGALRTHGGWRHRLAMITDRLGHVFAIRFQIYQKKFFMKFINNFITQLTPFFFFSIGGYLVIQGSVSLGALVAALAAYKDLTSPWKELLAYYNQAQDMSLRWETVMDRFSPSGVIEDRLMRAAPDDIPDLRGTLELRDVTVADVDGNLVLEQITMAIPQGALVAITAQSEEDRLALADVLTRELVPMEGEVRIAGHNLNDLHQATIAHRIGHANAKPVLFKGSLGDNIMMPMRGRPLSPVTQPQQSAAREALAAGNSLDRLDGIWLDPAKAGVADQAALRTWWLALIEAGRFDGVLFRKAMDQLLDDRIPAALRQHIVDVRPDVWTAVQEAGLEKYVYRFDPERYNPALPVASNLFFATLKRPMSQQELSRQTGLFALLRRLKLDEGLLVLSQDVIELLNQIFGTDGTEHPLFRKLGLDPVMFEKSVQVVRALKSGSVAALSERDKAILMTLPAQISAEQIGPAFTQEMQQRIVDQRATHGDALKEVLGDTYAPLDPQKIAPGMSVLENALFGKISDSAGGRGDEVRKIVSDVLAQQGLKPAVTELIYDMPLGLNGTNLPASFAEPLALSRAAIKRPDVLVIEQMFSGLDHAQRGAVHRNLRALLPETTMIYIADRFENSDLFDVHVEIVQGRMLAAESPRDTADDSAAAADLQRKVRALEATEMFSGLDRKQLRLLAFGSKWFHAEAGEVIFNQNDDPTDGAYMILSGSAQLCKPAPDGTEKLVTTVGPGTLVGELGLIRNVPRALTMRAGTDVAALRLGAEEFLAVVENDAATSFKLLQVVAGYTS
ncbi:cyclic nucleotide-binding domain-containing protein [Roseobacter weihaiensis]|uniref:cyclic nucleotide-binding domain-containing protein n=1 Tax=Roseobacter weihaiensis TaxID=2763262 RepID=UPI001D0B0054|nr:cyclic nucleotide-binding domain-containing protein [Roseobacter sp. H9]